MIRFMFTFDKDREEDWLNGWCQRGWAFASFFVGVVTFVPCEPGEFIYQIDLLPGTGLRASCDYGEYTSFMNEMGVDVLQRWGRWVYLRKRAEDGPFEIYTDLDSQIEMYRRMRGLFLWGLIVETVLAFPNVLRAFMERDVFLSCMGGIMLLIIITFVRAVRMAGQKIQELERQRQ